jgi:hypothetical protein
MIHCKILWQQFRIGVRPYIIQSSPTRTRNSSVEKKVTSHCSTWNIAFLEHVISSKCTNTIHYCPRKKMSRLTRRCRDAPRGASRWRRDSRAKRHGDRVLTANPICRRARAVLHIAHARVLWVVQAISATAFLALGCFLSAPRRFSGIECFVRFFLFRVCFLFFLFFLLFLFFSLLLISFFSMFLNSKQMFMLCKNGSFIFLFK